MKIEQLRVVFTAIIMWFELFATRSYMTRNVQAWLCWNHARASFFVVEGLATQVASARCISFDRTCASGGARGSSRLPGLEVLRATALI